jgi:acyl-CoA reductase-like NAD-dependent aldehyde dehydrogenase|tara:strand:+ start:1208 stop:2677 length:1470 start_codon:yes stop_codon:yes gene_type:complete
MSTAETIRLPSGNILVGKEWLPAQTGEVIDVINPATGKTFTQISKGGKADIDAAVRSARVTFESAAWSGMRPLDRSKLLERVAVLIENNAEELALLESLDNGKPVHLAMMVDIPSAVDVFRYMAGWCTKIYGRTLPVSGDGSHYHAYTLRQPIGVIGAIVPWNYPLAMASWKVASALAAGCTIVLKPSEETSLTALRLGELVLEAGIPSGALNIVTGEGHTAGQALITHCGVDKIAFTGSTAVGKHILRSSADDMRRVSLELGGKSPTIIMPDADLERAIPDAAMAIFFNSGQTCFAGSRLLCHEDIYDQVIEGICQIAKSLPIGSGQDINTMIGPVVNQKQKERILGYIQKGQSEGAELITGGSAVGKEGYFVEPTILSNASPESTIFNEEIFGPVLAATPFKDTDEAIMLANKTRYGLGANVYSRDMSTCHKLAAAIHAGSVWINTYFVVDPAMPFGGFKESGIGREVGEDGVLMYTEAKSVCAKLD